MNGNSIFFLLFLLLTLLQMFPFFPSLPPLPSSCTPLHSLWPSPHCCLCLWVMHICSLANPFTFFYPVPPSTSDGVSLFQLSMTLFLFCSSVHFVHQLSHISEIIWYLSFSTQLISLSMVFPRSIHTVAKGNIFFFTATWYSIV